MLNNTNPEDIRFTLERADAIVTDLFTYAFGASRNSRSEEYKQGFTASSFNSLVTSEYSHLYKKSPYQKGTCRHDAWLSGYDEGRIAACLFQINFLENSKYETSPVLTGPGNDSDDENISFSY